MCTNEDEGSFNYTSQELSRTEDDGRLESLPQKSRELYWATYSTFIKWKDARNVDRITENLLLTYMNELAEIYKPPTLWSKYSMLRSTIFIKHNIKIQEFQELLALLKQKSNGYEAKKSKVLTLDQVKRFLVEAPDSQYLATKVALIFCLCGACQHCELVRLTVKDVTNHDQIITVDLKDTKYKSGRTFVIQGELVEFVKAYQALRPQNTTSDRFFLTYRNSKCLNQPLGKNKFGTMPKEIAKFLHLENPEQYSGHSFRRSSTTLCTNQRITMLDLKREKKKTTAVAEDSIPNPIDDKTETVQSKINRIEATSGDELNSEPVAENYIQNSINHETETIYIKTERIEPTSLNELNSGPVAEDYLENSVDHQTGMNIQIKTEETEATSGNKLNSEPVADYIQNSIDHNMETSLQVKTEGTEIMSGSAQHLSTPPTLETTEDMTMRKPYYSEQHLSAPFTVKTTEDMTIRNPYIYTQAHGSEQHFSTSPILDTAEDVTMRNSYYSEQHLSSPSILETTEDTQAHDSEGHPSSSLSECNIMSRSVKRKRSFSQNHFFRAPTKSFKRKLCFLTDAIRKLRVELRRHQLHIGRLNKRINSLSNIVCELQWKRY